MERDAPNNYRIGDRSFIYGRNDEEHNYGHNKTNAKNIKTEKILNLQ